jgi:hypothetical protein
MVQRGIIASYVPPEAFEADAWPALKSLGYEIVPAGTPSAPGGQPTPPDLLIVDREDLEQIAGEEGVSTPIIVLTQQPAPPPADPRVIASLTRPARFHDIFAATQRALEPTPRRHARVTTAIPARCLYDDQSCTGAVTSLSEGGCLFRGTNGLSREQEVNLQFPLPRLGLISTRARQVNRRGSDLGLAFQDLPSGSRAAISQYVMDRLAAG